MTHGGRSLARRALREALDQGTDQLLLQPVRRFGADQRCRPAFDRADGSRMEVAQMPTNRRPRPPRSSGGRDSEHASGQRAAISNQLHGRHPDRAPAARPVGSRVQALARPEGHDLARSHPEPAPDRRRFAAARQRNQDHLGRHRDNGDPRQALLGSRQPQPVQGDLGQPRPKLATFGDEQAEAAFLAQRGPEILRFAEDRDNTTRHYSSLQWPEAGLAKLLGRQ
jgi:hypothetical protein